MPNSVRVILLLLAGFVAVAVMAPAVGLPTPSGEILTLAVATLGLYMGYRLNRPHQLRRKRLALGQCLACGYSLTGNISGVCPECGQAK